VVEWACLENRCGRESTVSSNLTPTVCSPKWPMGKIRLLIRITCVSSFLAVSPFSRALSAEREVISTSVEQGIILYVNGEIDKAIAEFTQGIRINSKDYVAYFQRAKAHEQQDNIDAAIADYDEVIKQCPAFYLCAQARYSRGLLYQKKRRLDDAIGDYTSLIESKCNIKGLLANAYNNRGLAYDYQGRYDLAISDYNDALDVVPKLFNAYYNRGATYANMGVYTLALEDFEKELELNRHFFPAVRYKLAILYYNQRDYQRSWYALFALMQSGERVSRALIEDLKKLRARCGSTGPDIIVSEDAHK
jgi:tetratricopeptide (TPR) repeat protein